MIAGINAGHTHYGMALGSGGAALVGDDGRLIAAVAEERLARRKYAGGHALALAAVLREAGAGAADLSVLAVSSCCDEGPATDLAARFPRARVLRVDHHVAHAASAFLASPFDEALVAVCDNEGNTTRPFDPGQLVPVHDDVLSFWSAPLERNSYFIGRGDSLALVAREFDLPCVPGIAEIYHRVTHYIGFGHHDAGKTMGLAPYGRAVAFAGAELFGSRADGLGAANLRDGFTAAEEYGIRAYLARHGYDVGPARQRFDFGDAVARDLAAWVQAQCERRFAESIRRLCLRHGLRNVCIAGGFGLNCPANAAVRALPEVERVFVQPAADDTGQCLGNALWAYCRTVGRGAARRWPDCIYTGPRLSAAATARAASHAEGARVLELDDEPLAARLAEALAAGALVGVCRGRSELGPRALGHRSILADARSTVVRDRLNEVKGREAWRPVAPVAALESAARYFAFPAASPHMTYTVDVRPEARALVAGAVHVDGSARLQTVTAQDEPFLHRVLAEFARRTGVACLLNTSFNAAGEPIVETAEEALRSARRMGLDLVVLGRWLVADERSEIARRVCGAPDR